MAQRTRFYVDRVNVMEGLMLFRRGDLKAGSIYARVSLKGLGRYKYVALHSKNYADAQNEAIEHYFSIKRDLQQNRNVFQRTFAQVAREFLEQEHRRTNLSGMGGITFHRWRVMDNHVKVHLLRYVGTKSVHVVGQEHWKNYIVWRQQRGRGRSGGTVSSATIRAEMTTFRSIMHFAALRKYVSYVDVQNAFSGRYLANYERREAFTLTEFFQLCRHMREWVNDNSIGAVHRWTREMVRNFILIMCSTGMRNAEARNLRWRDIYYDASRRRVIFSVHGKGKRRTFEARARVQRYLDNIKAISRAKAFDEYVFSTYDGKQSRTLYVRSVADILEKSGVALGSSGKRRSTYSFRHSFAVWRIGAGADIYKLALHMGTSIQMMQTNYGSASSRNVADNVLGASA
jgi:integrase